jgi:hypothetical protein
MLADVTTGCYAGFWILLYLALAVFLGVTCWLIGALLPSRRATA